MKQRILPILLFFSFCLNAFATEWYASPNGTSSNSGTETSPWDLQTALSHPSIVAGDTLWLRGGTYTGWFNSQLSGTINDYIIVSSYPGEIAVLDGNLGTNSTGSVLTITQPYVRYENFEVTMLGDFSRHDPDAQNSNDFFPVTGINHLSGKCELINLVIYNCTGSGIGSWKASNGTRIYGCLVYNNGHQRETTNAGGVGMYVQNSSDEMRQIENNILFNNFKTGVQVWSASTIPASPFDFVKNVNFNNNVILNTASALNRLRECFLVASKSQVPGQNIPKNINISQNFMYHNFNNINGDGNSAPFRPGGEVFRIGENNATVNPGEDIVVEDNYFVGTKEALRFQAVDKVTFRNNVAHTNYFFIRQNQGNIDANDWILNNNQYFTKNSSFYRIDGVGDLSLTQMQSTYGIDFGSSRSHYTALPNYIGSNKTISVTQNTYNNDRYKVVVYDKNGANVTVDFSSFSIPDGTNFTIRDAENYHGTPITGTINGGTVSFDPSNTALEVPNGTYPLNATQEYALKSDEKVGVFLIEFEPATGNSCNCGEVNPQIAYTFVDTCSIIATASIDNCSNITSINYFWEFTNGNSYNGQSPPVQGFIGPNGGSNSIKLTLSYTLDNGMKCVEIEKEEVFIPCRGSSGGIKKVSPNPTSGKFTLEANTEIGETYDVTVYDMIGRLVLSKKGLKSPVTSYNLSKNLPGIYIVEIKTNSTIETKKLILK